jgi:hypothetical protein
MTARIAQRSLELPPHSNVGPAMQLEIERVRGNRNGDLFKILAGNAMNAANKFKL